MSRKFLLIAAALPLTLSSFALADDGVEFARDIQPLFANKCVLCHGPDDAEGGLQLHSRETALAELDSGEHAIVPGKTAESELLRRVISRIDLSNSITLFPCTSIDVPSLDCNDRASLMTY